MIRIRTWILEIQTSSAAPTPNSALCWKGARDAGPSELEHTQTYPLDAAPDALADLDAGRVRGRAILTP